MRKALIFDQAASECPYADFSSDVNNGYGCNHPEQTENGCCFCFSCPLGVEAGQEDLKDPETDWDGMDEEEVGECEYLLVTIGDEATEDEKKLVENYDRYMHRYDQK